MKVIKQPLKAIREKCRECSNYSAAEIRECPVPLCPLYPFRFGKNPYRKKRVLSERERAELAERLAKAREK